VALERVPWPLDPRRATTRDEAVLVTTLLATPLRVDPRTGDLAPGLCTSWRRRGTVWTFRCADAAKVARAIPFGRVSVAGDAVRVRLPASWLRFPYLLTSAQSAVPGTRGPFEVVRARPGEIVAERGGLRIVFRQVEPHRAAVLFRRGELDEAPVPLGDIRAAQLDPRVRAAVHVTRLLGIDAIVFRPRGSLAGLPDSRNAYAATLDRGDYQALVPEFQADAATSLVPGYAPTRVRARDFRAARRQIATLPPVAVGFGADPDVGYGRDLLVAAWRDVGLQARSGGDDARLRRILAPYAQDEALLARLYVDGDACVRRALPPALRTLAQAEALRRGGDACVGSVVPVAWVADARFVSPRVRGWREDRLGLVDYARIRFRASSRHP
jgi:hypothetical protein